MRSKLRVIATVCAAALLAVGLSVGAALAEDRGPDHAAKGSSGAEAATHWSLGGVCLLDRKTVRPSR